MNKELNDTALNVSKACVGGSDIHKWDVPCVSRGKGVFIYYAKYAQAFYRALCLSYTCYVHTCFRD